ncbi:MAG: hypothetical protein ACR2RF_24765, partial [Geminicoccaceae bacterium]
MRPMAGPGTTWPSQPPAPNAYSCRRSGHKLGPRLADRDRPTTEPLGAWRSRVRFVIEKREHCGTARSGES